MPELNGPLSEGWFWLGGSLSAAILWTNLAWFFRNSQSRALGELLTRLSSSPLSPWLLQLLRLAYYLGVPFAALIWGHDVIIERVFGLKRLNLTLVGGRVSAEVAANWREWTQDTGRAAALGFGTWILLALGWWAYQRALVAVGERCTPTGTNSSGWVLLREAAYREVHWAFYRNVFILAVGTHWGAWLGAALAAMEAVLNPAWRRHLVDPKQAPAQLMRVALGVSSTLLFLMTQNLWLAVVVHWGVSWSLVIGVRILTPPRPSPEPDQVTV